MKKLSMYIQHSNGTLEDVINKANLTSSFEAEELFLAGTKTGRVRVFTSAISRFLRMFFLKGGFKDGLSGFFMSFLEAFTNFLTNLKLLKLSDKF